MKLTEFCLNQISINALLVQISLQIALGSKYPLKLNVHTMVRDDSSEFTVNVHTHALRRTG